MAASDLTRDAERPPGLGALADPLKVELPSKGLGAHTLTQENLALTSEHERLRRENELLQQQVARAQEILPADGDEEATFATEQERLLKEIWELQERVTAMEKEAPVESTSLEEEELAEALQAEYERLQAERAQLLQMVQSIAGGADFPDVDAGLHADPVMQENEYLLSEHERLSKENALLQESMAAERQRLEQENELLRLHVGQMGMDHMLGWPGMNGLAPTASTWMDQEAFLHHYGPQVPLRKNSESASQSSRKESEVQDARPNQMHDVQKCDTGLHQSSCSLSSSGKILGSQDIATAKQPRNPELLVDTSSHELFPELPLRTTGSAGQKGKPSVNEVAKPRESGGAEDRQKVTAVHVVRGMSPVKTVSTVQCSRSQEYKGLDVDAFAKSEKSKSAHHEGIVASKRRSKSTVSKIASESKDDTEYVQNTRNDATSTSVLESCKGSRAAGPQVSLESKGSPRATSGPGQTKAKNNTTRQTLDPISKAFKNAEVVDEPELKYSEKPQEGLRAQNQMDTIVSEDALLDLDGKACRSMDLQRKLNRLRKSCREVERLLERQASGRSLNEDQQQKVARLGSPAQIQARIAGLEARMLGREEAETSDGDVHPAETSDGDAQLAEPDRPVSHTDVFGANDDESCEFPAGREERRQERRKRGESRSMRAEVPKEKVLCQQAPHATWNPWFFAVAAPLLVLVAVLGPLWMHKGIPLPSTGDSHSWGGALVHEAPASIREEKVGSVTQSMDSQQSANRETVLSTVSRASLKHSRKSRKRR